MESKSIRSLEKTRLVRLEAVLRRQAMLKAFLRKGSLWRKWSDHPELKHAYRVALDLKTNERFVRVFAWKLGLDCFPESPRSGHMWLALYSVVYLGLNFHQAAEQFGFHKKTLEANLREQGWKRYKVWGRTWNRTQQQRFLVIPPALGDNMRVRYAHQGLEDVRDMMNSKDWRTRSIAGTIDDLLPGDFQNEQRPDRS